MIYTRQFVLLCLSSAFFFTSFNMLIPELPDFLSSLGGTEYKGYIISLFTLSACISRPFSGKLTDIIGRRPVMLFGVLVCCFCGLMYPLLNTVGAFLLLRFAHGFSAGFTPTATSAYVADVTPIEKRGEAMGMMGLTSNVGTAMGTVVGSLIAGYYSIDVLFYFSFGMGLLAFFMLLGMKETLPETTAFQWKHLKISRHEILEPLVFAPALVMLLITFPLGTMLTIIPDYSKYQGIENKGLFFAVYTVASLGVRFLAGKVSDKIGRVKVLQVACITLIVGLVMVAFANSIFMVLAAAIMLGFGIGTASPTLFAWTIDLGQERFTGRAIATLFISLEIGIGLGAFVTGYLYREDPLMFPFIFLLGAGLTLLALIYLFLVGNKGRLDG